MNFKPVLVVVILGSFLWGLLALPVPGHYFATLKLLTAVPVWGYVVVTAADIVSAWTSRPTAYPHSFYRTLGSDLKGAFGTGLVIACIYHFSTAHYDGASFDISAAAVPFALMTIGNVIAIGRAKIANRPMKRSACVALLALTVVCYGYIAATILKIASGHYGIWASTWLQLTILFVALFGYVETRRMRFVIKTGRIELSPFLLTLFGPDGPYGQLQGVAAEWNRRVAKEKATAAAATRSQAASKARQRKGKGRAAKRRR